MSGSDYCVTHQNNNNNKPVNEIDKLLTEELKKLTMDKDQSVSKLSTLKEDVDAALSQVQAIRHTPHHKAAIDPNRVTMGVHAKLQEQQETINKLVAELKLWEAAKRDLLAAQRQIELLTVKVQKCEADYGSCNLSIEKLANL
jgi:hypothetical protein